MIVLCVTLFLQSLLGITQALSGGGLDAFLLPSERRTFGDIQLTEGTVQFWDPGQRVFGTFGRYDRLGAFLAFVLLLVVAFVYESDKQPEWKWLGWLAVLGLPALLLTYSRSAWFGLIFGQSCYRMGAKRQTCALWRRGGGRSAREHPWI